MPVLYHHPGVRVLEELPPELVEFASQYGYEVAYDGLEIVL